MLSRCAVTPAFICAIIFLSVYINAVSAAFMVILTRRFSIELSVLVFFVSMSQLDLDLDLD